MSATTLIIEDDLEYAEVIARIVKSEGFEPLVTHSGEEGLSKYDEFGPELVLTDIGLPGIDGVEVTRQIKQRDPHMVCIIISGRATVETAVAALKAGAFDFIAKTSDFEEIRFRLHKALEAVNLRQQMQYLQEREQHINELVGDSEAMKQVRSQIKEIAATPFSTALVLGETGTGKELVARAIHRLSDRHKRPLVSVNCATIPDNLLESEFFGHERGSFTGADRRKKGLFELAHSGTLFLDEIGELDIKLQAKLLRVLEEKCFKRVGGVQDIAVDVRIIAATNQHLEEMVEEKRFRQDLMYRLNVFQINLPPLRERGQDILLLTYHFIEQLNGQLRKNVDCLDPIVERALLNFEFPGNVRQLRNLIERAMIMTKSERLTPDLFPGIDMDAPTMVVPTSVPSYDEQSIEALPLPEMLRHVQQQEAECRRLERHCYERALSEADGNKTKAADLIGISRYALQRRLRSLEIA